MDYKSLLVQKAFTLTCVDYFIDLMIIVIDNIMCMIFFCEFFLILLCKPEVDSESK